MGISDLDKDILELIEKKESLHKDDIYKLLIKKHDIAKKNQKSFKKNLYINYLSKLVREKLISKTGKNIYGMSPLESKTPIFVNQYAEKISLKKLNTVITLSKKFRKKIGFYFLYKGDHLYYVGIGNVITRLKSHAYADKHKGKWDNFSFYITESIEHAKEIETIIQRSAQIDGNVKRGKLKNAKNLTEHIKQFDSILEDLK
jgi:hypothetical protein